jgi:hypothetical protein
MWWTKDGANVSTTHASNTSLVLQLNAVSLNDTGNYSCHAAGEDKVAVVETVALNVRSTYLTFFPFSK